MIREGKRKDHSTFFLCHKGQLLSSQLLHREKYKSKKEDFGLFIPQRNLSELISVYQYKRKIRNFKLFSPYMKTI